MRNTAIMVSLVFIGVVGWLIFKPHNSVPEPTREPDAAVVEESSPQPVTSQDPVPVKKPPVTPAPVPPSKPQTTPSPAPVVPVDTTKYYTSAEVSSHASTRSCWSIINGKVYDLTSWIDQHPGGSSAIESLCGIDGSEDFNEQHGGQSRPERELAAFFIGVLK